MGKITAPDSFGEVSVLLQEAMVIPSVDQTKSSLPMFLRLAQ